MKFYRSLPSWLQRFLKRLGIAVSILGVFFVIAMLTSPYVFFGGIFIAMGVLFPWLLPSEDDPINMQDSNPSQISPLSTDKFSEYYNGQYHQPDGYYLPGNKD